MFELFSYLLFFSKAFCWFASVYFLFFITRPAIIQSKVKAVYYLELKDQEMEACRARLSTLND